MNLDCPPIATFSRQIKKKNDWLTLLASPGPLANL